MSSDSYGSSKKYRAFISYRHLEPDAMVAEKLQDLLERYRPPKPIEGRIDRIFRDRTELPLSGDLDQALREALLSSEYLIVIVSSRLKESKWCMEEIRAFKEADGGRIHHILPVLVEGEPQDVLPEELKWETVTEELPDGSIRSYEHEVEPLCCDVRGKNNRERRKELKTEYLRIAAPMLGCGFDDLFQRHLHRKRRQRSLLAGSIFAALAVVLTVVLWFFFQARDARNRFQANLTDNYIRQGAAKENEGDLQSAMMYYAGALSLDPDNKNASTGALMTLQEASWIVLEEEETGKEKTASENQVNPELSKETETEAEIHDSQEELFFDPESDQDYYAEAYQEDMDMSAFGERLRYYYDEPYALYGRGALLSLYDGDTQRILVMPRNKKLNPHLAESDMESSDTAPLAYPFLEEEAVVEYGGYLYLYHFAEKDDAGFYVGELTGTIDLWNLFGDGESEELPAENMMWVDRETGLAVISNCGYKAASLDLREQTLNAVHTRYDYFLENAALLPDGKGYVLLYGNSYGATIQATGGFAEVYNRNGALVSQTDTNELFIPLKAAFTEDSQKMALLGSGMLSVFETNTGRQTCAPLLREDMVSVSFTDESHLSVKERSGDIIGYRILTAESYVDEDAAIPETRNETDREYSLENGLTLSHNYHSLTILDSSGEKVDQKRIPLAFNRLTFQRDLSCCYLWYKGREDLCRISIDPEKGSLGEPELLRTLGYGVGFVCAGDPVGAVITVNKRLLTFPIGTDSYSAALTLAENGTPRSVACDGGRLIAVAVEEDVFEDSQKAHWDPHYYIELWDVVQGVLLGEPLRDGAYVPSTMYFDQDGAFIYKSLNERRKICLSAPEGIDGFADLVSGISCLEIGEQQRAEEKQPVLKEQSESVIQMLFSSGGSGETGGTPEDTLPFDLESLEQLYKEEGTDAWQIEVDQIWKQIEDGSIPCSLAEQKNYFTYCQNRTPSERIESMKTALQVFSDAVAEDGDAALDVYYVLTKGIDAILAGTDRLDPIIAGYYQKEAEANLESANEDPYRLLNAINYRFMSLYYSGQWDSISALQREYGIEEGDGLWDLLRLEGCTILPELADGDVNTAIESMEQYMDQLDEILFNQSKEEKNEAVKAIIVDAWMCTRHGNMKEEIVQEFCSLLHTKLGLEMGVSLQPVAFEDLENGFLLGDVVSRIDDTWIVSPVQAKLLSGKTFKEGVYLSRTGKPSGVSHSYKVTTGKRIPDMDGEFIVWRAGNEL